MTGSCSSPNQPTEFQSTIRHAVATSISLGIIYQDSSVRSKNQVNAEDACTSEALNTEYHRLQNLKHVTAMVELKPVGSVSAGKQDKPSPSKSSSSNASQSAQVARTASGKSLSLLGELR